jgi:hypothetical protein
VAGHAPATFVGGAPGVKEVKPDLLDKWMIEKPDLDDQVKARLAPQPYGSDGKVVVISNTSPYAINDA